jgi:hypothetical protein
MEEVHVSTEPVEVSLDVEVGTEVEVSTEPVEVSG